MGLFSKRDVHDNEEVCEVLSEVEEIRKSVLNAKMPQKVLKVALKEIERLGKTNSSATEYTIGINYLEYLASLPWDMMTEDNLDIARAQKILDAEHYGLADIKERILEHLAARKLKLSSSHTVLVVDDETDFVETIVNRLNKRMLDAKGVESGEAAVDLLKQELFDVVLPTLSIPGTAIWPRKKNLQKPVKPAALVSSAIALSPAIRAISSSNTNLCQSDVLLSGLSTHTPIAMKISPITRSTYLRARLGTTVALTSSTTSTRLIFQGM